MPDVKAPLVGKIPKPLLFGGILIGGVGGLYLFYRHKANASSATDTTGSSATDSSSSTDSSGYALDPYAADGQDYTGYGTYGFGGGGGGGYPYPYPNPAPSPTPTPSTGVPTTNYGWAKQAASRLRQFGISTGSSSPALLKYIAGLPVTVHESHTVQDAIGLEGEPPQNGPNGYPPKIHVVHTKPSNRRTHPRTSRRK